MAETAIMRKRIAITTHTACDPLESELWSATQLSCWKGTADVVVTITVTVPVSWFNDVSAQVTESVGVTVTVMMWSSVSELVWVHWVGATEVASVIKGEGNYSNYKVVQNRAKQDLNMK